VSTPKVAATILTRNRRDLLRQSLDAVLGQTRPVDHLIVVDNESSDGTVDMLASEFPHVTVVALPENQGATGGFYEAIAAGCRTDADWLWLMDDDSIARPTALAELLAAIERADGAAPPVLMCSRVEWRDGRPHMMNRPVVQRRGPARLAGAVRSELLPVRAATWVSLLISRQAVERSGMPPRHFFYQADDIEYTARVLFLCASALNSTWLLLRSATEVWPGGLGSSSGELGHNLMDHHFRVGAEGTIEGLDDKYYNGRRPTGFYIPRYRNLVGDKRPYLRGFGYQGGASRQGWSRAVAELGVGGAFKDAMAQPGPWSIGATAFGEMLPNHANRVTIDASKKDKWGLPVLAIDCATGENERLMRRDMMNDMAETLEAAGMKNVRTYDNACFPGMGIHEMGTARMGRDPRTSVLNAHNQVWDAANVFVTDGACMASSACQNPSLTYMALTARAADFAVSELKRNNL